MQSANKYSGIAIRAAKSAAFGASPVDAWDAAASAAFPVNTASAKKSCPRSSFLGLAEAGEIAGIASGNYTKSHRNKRYALRALQLLRNGDPSSVNAGSLWLRVMAQEGSDKVSNGQMEVVLGLWQSKQFVGQ